MKSITSRAHLGSTLAFLDTLFNIAQGFALLMCVSLLLIKPTVLTPAKPAVEMKAELVITMTWPEGSLDDQDLWVQLPDGRRIGYSFKDVGVATLDRDDTGGTPYNIWVDGGELKLQPIRKEMVTIRAIIPGRYVVNVHTFATRQNFMSFTNPRPLPYEVEAVMVKLNPQYKEVVKRRVTMDRLNDQKTFFAFVVGSDGSIVSVDTEADEPFLDARKK